MSNSALRITTNVPGFPVGVYLIDCGQQIKKSKGGITEVDPKTGEKRFVPNPEIVKTIYLRTEGGELAYFASAEEAQHYIDSGQADDLLERAALEKDVEIERARQAFRERQRRAAGVQVVEVPAKTVDPPVREPEKRTDPPVQDPPKRTRTRSTATKTAGTKTTATKTAGTKTTATKTTGAKTGGRGK